jgi:hypothetical protein
MNKTPPIDIDIRDFKKQLNINREFLKKMSLKEIKDIYEEDCKTSYCGDEPLILSPYNKDLIIQELINRLEKEDE